MEARTKFGERLKDYGRWRAKVDVDRFVILVFSTADEKRIFASKVLGDGDAVYVDGQTVELRIRDAEKGQKASR